MLGSVSVVVFLRFPFVCCEAGGGIFLFYVRRGGLIIRPLEMLYIGPVTDRTLRQFHIVCIRRDDPPGRPFIYLKKGRGTASSLRQFCMDFNGRMWYVPT